MQFIRIARKVVNVLQNHLKDLKVLIIYRKDLVAQYGSAVHAKKSGIWHSWYKECDKMKASKIKISKWRFIAYVARVVKMYDALKELKNTHDVLELYYEDLILDPSNFYRKIYQFLNLPIVNPTWLKSKKVLPPPQDYIFNYEEMVSLQRDLENGTVPAYAVFISKCIEHLIWRIKTFQFPNRSLQS